jgi:hypothetical protein
MNQPCNFDHNGECLICDCWIGQCAWERLLKADYTYESYRELLEMFQYHMARADMQQLVDARDNKGNPKLWRSIDADWDMT